MRFQMKILFTYSIFIVVLIVILGGFFYKHSTDVIMNNAYSNISVISDKMSQQLDNLVNPMEFKTAELLSDESFLTSMTTLATLDRNQGNNRVYTNEANTLIYSKLVTYSINKNFYRVSVFNMNGDFITSNFRVPPVSGNIMDIIRNLSWRKKADDAAGSLIIIPPNTDPWASADRAEKVFAVARSVQWPSSGMGYIEIQKPYTEFQQIFDVPDKTNTKVVAVTNTGEVLYSGGITDKVLLEYYKKLALSGSTSAASKKNSVSGKDEIVAAASSAYTGVSIAIAQDRSALLKSLLFTARTTVLIGFIIIVISIIFIYILSKQLTDPLKQLKEKMENTELENLPEEIDFERSNNEIEALNNSFLHLKERLNEAVRREMKSQALQMRAQFDSLQAQVNPHFIYNILNVLSNKGIENGDDEICEICDGIAAMLRYSTSTLKRSATIADEIEHVQNYLLLMKKRFEHRLEFAIDIDHEIYGEAIPKIVLQQIVENSVNHGFEKGQKVVRIEIKGYVKEDWWYIEITDNGCGFEDEVLHKLEKKMETMKRDILKGESKTGLAIGGMGIINTYGRLLLFYKNKFVFEMKNNASGGAQVRIGSIIGASEEEDLK